VEALGENMTEDVSLLEIDDLRTMFDTENGPVAAVDGVTLKVDAGEVVAIVGESGSGKSVTALSVMRLLPSGNGRVVRGSIRLLGRDLLGLRDAEMRRLRGGTMSMIFQDPVAALNPVFTIGDQIVETIRLHLDVSRAEARRRAIDMLDQVGIVDPAARLRQYPHELSGGMCQRVMIAIALVCDARLLIADEPTTGLDVTVQAQILDLCKEMRALHDVGILLITHDMGVVADLADRVVVYYAGQVVEEAAVYEFFRRPLHPYSAGLMTCIPDPWARSARMRVIPGTVPRLDSLPAGCRFSTRCEFATDVCRTQNPDLVDKGGGRRVRCHRADELTLRGTMG
jgi:oligopeptide/dipeptide ABC transporter ATP-binding protein